MFFFGSVSLCVDPPIFQKPPFGRAFAAVSARLHTLGKQQLFQAPQQLGPRNGGENSVPGPERRAAGSSPAAAVRPTPNEKSIFVWTNHDDA